MARTDVLVVAAGATGGWRSAEEELAASLQRAGATVALERARDAPRVRTFALTDFVQASLAREACLRGVRRHDPTAIIYCSITAALLWPRPGAISLDSIAAENRPGRHGIWQRSVERRRVRRAPLLLGWSENSLAPLRGAHAEMVVVPPPVDGAPSGAPRDIAAVTYAGNPEKRRLGLVLQAWRRARREHESLLVAGTDAACTSVGVEVAGLLAPAEFRALLSRARVFIAAPEREDFGIAALEALAHGCLLVSTPSPGPYPALELARRLDPRLIGDDLTGPIRTALDDPVPGYAERAAPLLAPFRREAIDKTVVQHVLPRLVPRFRQ